MKKLYLVLNISILGVYSSQNIFQPGELFVVAVNANNFACSMNSGEDVIYMVSSVDITTGTEIDFTDNGWERVNTGYFGTTEGEYRMTRTGATIPAGTIFQLVFPSVLTASVINASNLGWSKTAIPTDGGGTFNLNSTGDQFFVMQGGNWTETTSPHFGSYSGTLLYAFNTKTVWQANGGTQDSNLPSALVCFHTNANAANSDYIYYSGPTTAATTPTWFIRFNTPGNWTNATNCADFNTFFTLSNINFLDTFISQPVVFQEICKNDTALDLTFSSNGNITSYQWYVNSSASYINATPIAGANSVIYSPPTQTVGDYFYYCEITINNSCPVYTELSELLINDLPLTTNINPN